MQKATQAKMTKLSTCITVKMVHWEFAACSARRPLLTHCCVLTLHYSPVCLQVSHLWNIIRFKIALAKSFKSYTSSCLCSLRGICHTAFDHRAVCCTLWLMWSYANEKCHPEAFGCLYNAQHNLLNMFTAINNAAFIWQDSFRDSAYESDWHPLVACCSYCLRTLSPNGICSAKSMVPVSDMMIKSQTLEKNARDAQIWNQVLLH